MRNFKKISIMGLAVILGSFYSCKKILEQEPKNSPYVNVFWKSAKDASNAISGNYALLRNACTNKENRYYMYGDAIAQNYFSINYTGTGIEDIVGGNFTGVYNIQTLANYTLYYKAITMSNIVIANVSKMSDTDLKDESDPTTFRKNIIGQAQFIRALSYFMMVRVWGDVPLVTEAYDDPINAPRLPRSSKILVMKQIENDCQSAIKNLSWTYENAGDAKVTANKGSAYALLTHLYLWRATMSDVSTDNVNLTDVNSADTCINAITSNGGYSLTDTSNYKSTFIGRSPEGIFELNMSENTLEGSNASIGYYFLNGSYINNGTNTPRYYVVPRYLTLHYGSNSTDIRFQKNFDLVTPDKPLCIKYSNLIYRNPGQKLDPYLSNNMIIFRLSDFKLLKAEIALYKGDAVTATNIINDSRRRNNPNPDLVPAGLSVSAVMDQYLKERGREMYLEGHIFYDLLRTRKYSNFTDWLTTQRFRSEGFYWPIDPALFRDNPNLKQTTYWLGKV